VQSADQEGALAHVSEDPDMAFVKKNPWVLLVVVFAALIAVGIATTWLSSRRPRASVSAR